jgi:hypothetical protein
MTETPHKFHENQTENRYMRGNMTSLLFVVIQNDNQQSNVVVAKEVDGAIHVDINDELPLFPPDILVHLDEASMYLSILHKSKIIMRFLLTLPGIEKVEYVTGSQTDDVCVSITFGRAIEFNFRLRKRSRILHMGIPPITLKPNNSCIFMYHVNIWRNTQS